MARVRSYHGVDDIVHRLQSVQSRRWMLRLVAAGLALLTVVAGCVLLLALALGYWPDQPPALLRWMLLAGTSLAVLFSLVWLPLRAVLWRQNAAQTARFIEQHLPEVRNDLINSLLLAGDAHQPSGELVQEAISEAYRHSARIDLDRSVSLRSVKRRGAWAGAAVVVLAAVAVFQGGPLRRGLAGAIPTRYVPRHNGIELLELLPGDATRFAGEPLTIQARIENNKARRWSGQVLIEGREQPLAMEASDGFCAFTAPMGPVSETFRYAVRIGDSRWPRRKPFYTVTVLQRVRIEGLDIEYSYPPYTRLKNRIQTNAPDGSIEAPMGTDVKLTLRLGGPVPQVLLERDGVTRPMAPQPGRTSFSSILPIVEDGSYRLILKDPHGNTIQQLPDSGSGGAAAGSFYRVRAIPDPPPKVAFLRPNRDVAAAPGDAVRMEIQASDTYGLTELRLSADREDAASAAPGLLRRQFPVAGKTKARVTYTFQVPENYPDDGSVTIVYYASATDSRNLPGKLGGPQTTTSGRFKITVQNAARVSAERARQYEQLRKRLMKLLRMQETQRVNTAICRSRHEKLPDIRTTGAEIAAAQKAIRSDLVDLVQNFPFDKEMIPVQHACALLAGNEARLAVSQAEVLAALAAMDRREAACALLAGTQDRIIDTLQTLLAILPSLASRPEARQRIAGADIPPEAQQKLRQLKDNLRQFIDAQKKIIEASQRLAKKPVDAFTAGDERLLRQLQAAQDKWEKFLNESFTDFSKMAQQDFSNPVLLKELISVKSDVTMARDALEKKATEIATAAEDSGIENAKTLTANIEKWLPDEPDRVKWSMEDPLDGQTNVEQPELPSELEDLVGDLLEQEEDLFDEVDDLTSKYTMSGDKGIGWDAMDGPISNMNAQGVTGNQLPNTSELAGRSGEGRQGKSVGEFVEDKAVGKGGRRTPTRLTPEPFQKGQVDDRSSEPAGGSTGGGKLSGAGHEGLEGPLPPELAKQLQRLAGKQASLINRAEKHSADYRPSDYRNFQLRKMITLMGRVYDDLVKGRYQNVLRARHETLAALRQSALLLTGNVRVTADPTTAMPKYIRRDIADAMKGDLPPKYREILQQYYRRLSEEAGR
jgi:hypothetical protein